MHGRLRIEALEAPALAALAFTASVAGGCAASRSGPALPASLQLPQFAQRRHAGPSLGSPIRHVVIIVQENRSFDDLWQGYPGADTQAYGYDHKGKKIVLQPIGLQAPYDLDHSSAAFFTDYDNGKMDGFDLEGTFGKHGPNPTYGYVPHSQSKLYFEMAKQYALGDRMFTSHLDASFVSHQYLIAAQAQGSVDLPSGVWGCDGGSGDTVVTLTQDRTYGPAQQACFDYTTLGDELDGAGLPWRFYAIQTTDIWSAYQAVSHIRYGSDWANVIAPNTNFFTDIAGGTLGAVTWIVPSCTNSDHSGCEGKTGPQWVASLVNAVGESPFWSSTQIFVMWDEWGGWYDHVPPPYEDYDGLGMRVGLLMLGPYVKKKYVTHVQYEHGSILRFAEDQFGLAQLSAADARANSPEGDAIDFSQAPRAFVPFETKLKARDFINAPPDRRPPDNT
jgi:phospholipase C